MNAHYNTRSNQYEELLLSVNTTLLNHKYTDDRLIVIGDSRSGKTVFLKELINHLRKSKQTFCAFSAHTELTSETFIPIQDKLFNPWSSQEFTLPMVDFTAYQSKVIPILNDFINTIEHDDSFNLFIDYPITNDSEGNRFVLNSLINIALIKNSWLIIDELNFKDILQNIGNSLHSRGKIAVAVNHQSRLEELSLDMWEQNYTTINNSLRVLKITPMTI